MIDFAQEEIKCKKKEKKMRQISGKRMWSDLAVYSGSCIIFIFSLRNHSSHHNCLGITCTINITSGSFLALPLLLNPAQHYSTYISLPQTPRPEIKV